MYSPNNVFVCEKRKTLFLDNVEFGFDGRLFVSRKQCFDIIELISRLLRLTEDKHLS